MLNKTKRMTSESGKQYGLILPKKGSAQEVIKRPSCFDEKSNSGDSDGGGDWVKKSYQRQSLKVTEKRQIKNALAQDASIYQYDEVYDDIKDKAIKSAPKKEEKKQSRYIQSLKRNAERRKLENERRMERQVQKERQEEGEEFKDKETFVTSSYKKKLEEFQQMDEEEKRMDRLEDIGDVSKQKDISGFYRHLYKTTVDTDQPQDEKAIIIKKEHDNSTELIQNTSPIKELDKDNLKSEDSKQKRQYRKRTNSASSKEEGEKTTSSSSSSSSSSSESEDSRPKLKKKEKESERQSREKTPIIKKRSVSRGKENIESSVQSVEDDTEIKQKNQDDNVDNVGESLEEPSLPENIWLKRTIGIHFDNALRQYLERKSKRQGSY